MDPQPHSLLHFLVRMKPTYTNVFFSGCQKCRSHKGKYRGCMEDVDVFDNKISEVYPSSDWQHGDGRYHAKGLFRPTKFYGVLTLLRIPEPSATKKRITPLCSSLFASVLNAGRTHFTFTSRAIKNNCVDLCVFTVQPP